MGEVVFVPLGLWCGWMVNKVGFRIFGRVGQGGQYFFGRKMVDGPAVEDGDEQRGQYDEQANKGHSLKVVVLVKQCFVNSGGRWNWRGILCAKLSEKSVKDNARAQYERAFQPYFSTPYLAR